MKKKFNIHNKKKAILISCLIGGFVVVATGIAVPLAVLLPQKTAYLQKDIKGSKWEINQEINLNTTQILEWKSGYWGTDSRLTSEDYRAEYGTTAMFNSEMAARVSKDVTSYFLIDCLVQMIRNHYEEESTMRDSIVEMGEEASTILDGASYSTITWEASIVVKGIHVNKDDRKFKIDSIHYAYGDRYNEQEKVDRYIWGINWMSIVGVGAKETTTGRVGTFTAAMGSMTDSCWEILGRAVGRKTAKFLSAPMNFADANACTFPDSESVKIFSQVYSPIAQGGWGYSLEATGGQRGYDSSWRDGPDGQFGWTDFTAKFSDIEDSWGLTKKFTLTATTVADTSTQVDISNWLTMDSIGNFRWLDGDPAPAFNTTDDTKNHLLVTVTCTSPGYQPGTAVVPVDIVAA